MDQTSTHSVTVQTKAKKVMQGRGAAQGMGFSPPILPFAAVPACVTLWLLCSLTTAQQWLNLVVRYRSIY